MQNMASWDSTADNAAGTKGCYILDAGDYWFTIGNGAHEAVNNVLAAEGQSVDGTADKAKSWTPDSFDGTTFATIQKTAPPLRTSWPTWTSTAGCPDCHLPDPL